MFKLMPDVFIELDETLNPTTLHAGGLKIDYTRLQAEINKLRAMLIANNPEKFDGIEANIAEPEASPLNLPEIPKSHLEDMAGLYAYTLNALAIGFNENEALTVAWLVSNRHLMPALYPRQNAMQGFCEL